jgi:hypothetical protein
MEDVAHGTQVALAVDDADTEPALGFPDGLRVDVEAISARRWRVLTAFVYRAQREEYVVPAGEETDFASVPRPFVWLIPTYGRYTKAAILHDWLCRRAATGDFSRRDADGIFRQAMRTLNVAFLRRWVMWGAVRWGAFLTPEGRRDWLRDAGLVIPMTVLVLPIVAPAALLIVATLLVWYVAEWVVWVPLALVRRAKAIRSIPAKRVNSPELTIKL